MRLIDIHSLRVVEFLALPFPSYAILSHTWEEDEISYQEMTSPNSDTWEKRGYKKIKSTCHIAAEEGFDYVWIDTCCIDKTSSAELSEAINSMFNWYARAEKCYVYLSDLKSETLSVADLNRCRWITRGWTLQELIAPRTIQFHNANWKILGSKESLMPIIISCTGIDRQVLLKNRSVHMYPAATRMSWAAERKTTRTEDMAYCLLGIFDVNMPLLYGEEHKSFRRLQEEIIKTSSDMTVLAWNTLPTPYCITPSKHLDMNLLASEPACFRTTPGDKMVGYKMGQVEFSITSKGIFVSGETRLVIVRFHPPELFYPKTAYILHLGFEGFCGISLRKINKNTYFRDIRHPLVTSEVFQNSECMYTCPASGFYIVENLTPNRIYNEFDYLRCRENTVRVAQSSSWIRKFVSPASLWDEESEIFLKPDAHDHQSGYHSNVLSISLEGYVEDFPFKFIACCVWPERRKRPSVALIHLQSYPQAFRRLSDLQNRIDGVKYYDIEPYLPGLEDEEEGLNQIIFVHGEYRYKISATWVPTWFQNEFGSVDVHELWFDTLKTRIDHHTQASSPMYRIAI